MKRWSCVLSGLALTAFAAAARGQPPALPDGLRNAPPNTWVLPKDSRFLILGGAMQMLTRHKPPYTEMTLNLPPCRWENRFPKGKEGLWGEPVGPSRAPGFSGSYYRVAMQDEEGNVRPYLGSGYDRAMYLFHNFAYDSDRGRVVVAWHLGEFTAEYDPAERTWQVIETAKDVPEGFWDDFLWGAMCYDPVNKEVLGGRGRWAYTARTGTWRRLSFASTVLDGPRAAAERLRLRAKDLVGAARSRYYRSETPEEAKLQLGRMAEAIANDAAALDADLARSLAAAGRDKAQIAWARAELKSARAAMLEAAGRLQDKVTREAVWKAEDARDLLERCALSLATAPPPRAWSPMAYDPANQKIVMFGGDRMDRLLADTRVYDCPSRSWQLRRPEVSPPPRAGHGLAYLPNSGKLLLVDGYGIGSRGQSWVYDTAANRWSLLAEPDAKRPPLTGRGVYSFLPGPLAVGPGDLAVMTSHREGSGITTWAARIDASKLDPAGTKKLGVGFLTMSTRTGPMNPRYYEQTGPPPDPAEEDRLKDLPVNTWVRLSPPNNPRTNRAWGTTVLDAARDQLIQWGGGHAAYCGNDVLHYSITTNRVSTGGYLPDTALNWDRSMLGPPMTTTFAGRPHTRHGYHHYGLDPATNNLLTYSRMSGNTFYLYDPHTRGWKGRFGRSFPDNYQGGHNFTCVPHPNGLLVWATPRLLLQLDAKTMTWKELPLAGNLPGMRVDCHGMAYDSRRERLLFFSMHLKGDVVAYDMKTHQVKRLAAAGGDKLPVFLREALYLPHADLVMAGTRRALEDGSICWLFYDCARNAWVGIRLPGDDPLGNDPKVQHGVSLGLSYDAKRKLLWCADDRMTIRVLRLDPKTADLRRLAEPTPAKDSSG